LTLFGALSIMTPMLVKDILLRKRITVSFEFFPPKNEQNSTDLFNSIKELAPLKPDFVSVTYGAGGSTQTLTQELVLKLHQQTSLTVVAHLTCVGASAKDTENILQNYHQQGIMNIMALRGDPPSNFSGAIIPPGGFPYAINLVHYIKKQFPQMGVGVAGFPEGHPECPNRLKEMEYLKAKVDAGADYICTQLFFDNRDFYDFRERCELAGIKIPIIAGIMPITSQNGLKRMAELALGARFPARLLKAIGRASGPEEVKKVGIHWATEQVRDLIDNQARGIHFYTLNKSRTTMDIYQSLGIQSSDALQEDKTFI